MPRSRTLRREIRRQLLTDSSEKVSDKTPVPPPDWEALIAQIADEIMAEHTPARILQVRAKLYDLLSHCIPPTTILKVRPHGPTLCIRTDRARH